MMNNKLGPLVLVVSLMLACHPTAAQDGVEWSDDTIRRYEGWQMIRIIESNLKDPSSGELQLSDGQAIRLEQICDDLRSESRLLTRQQTARNSEAIILRNTDREEEADAIQRELFEEQDDLWSRYLRTIVDEVLLPHQVRELTIAARRRRMLSQLNSDIFLIPILVATEKGLPDEEVEAIRELVRQARDSYATKLKEIREELFDDVISTLAVEQQNRFEELYGDPYDYFLEVYSTEIDEGKN